MSPKGHHDVENAEIGRETRRKPKADRGKTLTSEVENTVFSNEGRPERRREGRNGEMGGWGGGLWGFTKKGNYLELGGLSAPIQTGARLKT